MDREFDSSDPEGTRRIAGSVAAALVFLLVAAYPEAEARADRVRLPREGQQFFAGGLSLQPGFLYDRTAPAASPWRTVAAAGMGTARFGFHQLLTETFIMSAEADVGLQWLNEHTAETGGRAASELAFGWQLALAARWLPAGERAGWSLGAGTHYYSVYLADRPLQSVGLDLRAGKYIWRSSEQFVLLEIGYAVPVIQGLTGGSSYTDGDRDAAPKNWTFHRFALSLQYGF